MVYCARRLVEGGATLRRIGQGLIGGAIALVALGAVPSMAAAADRLPDLGMARVSDVHMDNAANGRRLVSLASWP